MMYIHTNIKFLRKKKGVTQAIMAEAVRITRSKLAGYELNVNPPLDVVVRLSEYLEVSVDLLLKENLNGHPEHRIREILETNRFFRGRDLHILATTVDTDGKEFIEVVSQRAKASYLAGFEDPDFIGELPRFSLPFLSEDKKYRVFQVDGDSMDPIPDGAWIVCEYVDDWTVIKDGEKYVVVSDKDGITFKLAYMLQGEENKILLCSTNPVYKPFSVEMEMIKEVWKYRMMIV